MFVKSNSNQVSVQTEVCPDAKYRKRYLGLQFKNPSRGLGNSVLQKEAYVKASKPARLGGF